MSTIETRTVGRILSRTGDTTGLVMRYLYDPADPAIITIRFLAEGTTDVVVWEIDRCVLVAAVDEEFSRVDGDGYTFGRIGEVLHMHLEGEDGTAMVLTKAAPALDFVALTLTADVEAFDRQRVA